MKSLKDKKEHNDILDANRDPITGAPGAHPVGVGVGAAAGGATGAAIGMVGGPVGSLVGATIGAVAGGLAGKGVAEQIDPTVEDAHWRNNYSSRPYVKSGSKYELYQPAYRYGWECRSRYANCNWDEVEPELERGWNSNAANSAMSWNAARDAARDAWDHADTYCPQ